jgi:hypothetical protein
MSAVIQLHPTPQPTHVAEPHWLHIVPAPFFKALPVNMHPALRRIHHKLSVLKTYEDQQWWADIIGIFTALACAVVLLGIWWDQIDPLSKPFTLTAVLVALSALGGGVGRFIYWVISARTTGDAESELLAAIYNGENTDRYEVIAYLYRKDSSFTKVIARLFRKADVPLPTDD